ncbi:MAG: fumarate hydratase [Peptococcaceae bacterium BICA1-7]|nr:MAG: fumarate hydratase [Peptococcaceae bacterium BICA1-7]HBV97486.1 Fe-S-containing hydro-lyase [Desulfotomaculum sp.]
MPLHRIKSPISEADIKSLRCGDEVLLTGTIFTARDAAHKRLIELIEKGEDLPVDLKGQIIYYVGPCPPRPGQAIGSAGPTTAYRMDPFTPAMLSYGVKGTIGKGPRRELVKEACSQYGAVYLAGIGGASALLAMAVEKAEVVAYADLGTEAIRRLEVVDFPLIVAYDIYGGDVFQNEIPKYAGLDLPVCK